MRQGRFEALYAADPDPWNYAASAYERKKYAASLAALPPRRFPRGLEIGCSIGVFSVLIARHCDFLLALDAAAAALARARNPGNICYLRRQMPWQWPRGLFDLIVLSEVLYYFDARDRARLLLRTVAARRRGGLVLMVNFLGKTSACSSGMRAAGEFIRASGLATVARRRNARYRIDVLRG